MRIWRRGWRLDRHGYVDDEALHRQMTDIRRQLAALPSPWLIARVETAERHVVRIVPTEPARPFLAWAEHGAEDETCAGVAPPDGLEPPTRTLGRCRSIH